jgi:2,3-bisphosphoglycerate-dependent phosphoglycerate mutase
VVYTSWLSRAIETAWLVLDELDLLWLPIIKTWRLNERMYGALTGLSKQMVAQRHGDETLKKWRRGYADRPPAISSFSSIYPGNDDRYVSNVVDVRYSVFESLIRSIGDGKLELHRKFPKTESLKDCMQRTIPYYVDKIVPDSIAQGKNVLIASSENAIRGLLMHLCEIPWNRIHEVEIPTGLPLVFNVEKKCIQLLDDGLHDFSLDPLARYDFGTSPELLFKPCGEDADSCYLGGDGKSYAWDPVIRLPLETNEIRTPFDDVSAVPTEEILGLVADATEKISAAKKLKIDEERKLDEILEGFPISKE